MEILAPEPYPRIPDDLYEAQCFKYEYSRKPYSKVYLKFKITQPGKYNGLRLFKPYNIPPDGGRPPWGSKYFKDWSMVNNSRFHSVGKKVIKNALNLGSVSTISGTYYFD